MRISTLLAQLARDQRATSSVEYAIILTLISLAVLSAISNFGNAVQTTWSNVSTQTSSAVGAANAGA